MRANVHCRPAKRASVASRPAGRRGVRRRPQRHPRAVRPDSADRGRHRGRLACAGLDRPSGASPAPARRSARSRAPQALRAWRRAASRRAGRPSPRSQCAEADRRRPGRERRLELAHGNGGVAAIAAPCGPSPVCASRRTDRARRSARKRSARWDRRPSRPAPQPAGAPVDGRVIVLEQRLDTPRSRAACRPSCSARRPMMACGLSSPGRHRARAPPPSRAVRTPRCRRLRRAPRRARAGRDSCPVRRRPRAFSARCPVFGASAGPSPPVGPHAAPRDRAKRVRRPLVERRLQLSIVDAQSLRDARPRPRGPRRRRPQQRERSVWPCVATM